MPQPELVRCRGPRSIGEYAIRAIERRTESDPASLRRMLLLVPTAAARHLLRLRLDRFLEGEHERDLPEILTPSELQRRLTTGLVDPLLREALLEKAFETAERDAPAPFPIRGGLAYRVLELYDELHASAEANFERFIARALEELDDPDDEGARKMAEQTRFLGASISIYRASLEELGLVDGAGASARLPETKFPFDRVVVLGAETTTPAEIDFLSKVDGIEKLELVVSSAEPAPDPPRMIVPSEASSPVFVARDREEALIDVARLLKHLERRDASASLARVAVVVPRPLPYLYLAKKVFAEAGIPYQLQDAFPLATEPYLAAFDSILELVASAADRASALSLLRNPFFRFPGVGTLEVAAFDALTLRYHERGGAKRWRSLHQRKSRSPAQPSLPGMEGRDESKRALPALAAILDAIDRLAPLADPGPATEKIGCLRDFLERYGAPLTSVVPESEVPRHRRARGALASILERLEAAARRVDDPAVSFHAFRERLRRAVEAHTFALTTGAGGVQIVEARSAFLGDFELVLLLGLNESEWPARRDRNIFYPQWLLREFGWPSDRDLLSRERGRFHALLDLASRKVALFRHHLEDEIPTVESPFLEDVDRWLERNPRPPERLDVSLEGLVVTRGEALRLNLVPPEKTLVRARQPGMLATHHSVPEPISPTAFELYLRCPFKYFARYVLGLEEEEPVEETLTPLERGRILHELLQEAFAEWDRGRDAPREVDAESYEEFLEIFRRLALVKIPAEHRRLELARLFGGPGEPGAIPWLARREMARGRLRKRLVEHGFRSPLRLSRGPRGETPWFVQIKGRVDRADIDAEGRLHVFDYKSGRAPEGDVTLQVPLYAMCLSQELGAPIAEAQYLSFRDRKASSRADFQKAGTRLLDVHRALVKGDFAPRPFKVQLCNSCGFVGVCRKEIREEAEG